MGNSIKPNIEHAERTGVCNIAGQGLNEFPADILRLTKNLRTLDMSANKLPAIPPAFGKFLMMKNLNLSNNRLVTLPSELGNLKKLESLQLSSNRLSSVPSTLNQLKSLKSVVLSHNFLTSFPTQFCSLKHLDLLDISHNKITQVPDDVRSLHAVEFNINQNQLSHISEAIAECERLKVLRVEENCLQLNSFTPKIMKDSNISLFAMEGNVFDSKKFNTLDGYDQYMERYTATRKKMT